MNDTVKGDVAFPAFNDHYIQPVPTYGAIEALDGMSAGDRNKFDVTPTRAHSDYVLIAKRAYNGKDKTPSKSYVVGLRVPREGLALLAKKWSSRAIGISFAIPVFALDPQTQQFVKIGEFLTRSIAVTFDRSGTAVVVTKRDDPLLPLMNTRSTDPLQSLEQISK